MPRSPLRPMFAVALAALLAGCAAETSGGGGTDLGDFPIVGKADSPVVVEVPFVVHPAEGDDPGEAEPFVFRTSGQLAITTHQDEARSWERLQLVADSDGYRRRSWRGRAPYVTIPAERVDGEMTEYTVTMLNWGTEPAYGFLRVETEVPDEAGVQAVFNTPDCDDGCQNPAGELRKSLVDAIQSARSTIDMAAYGLDDGPIREALCNAVAAGVRVRVVTDETSEDPNNSRSYWPAFFSPTTGLAGCGAEVHAVRSYGLMHHKFFLIDGELLVTGSTNLTAAGLDKNHNHMLFVRGAPELVASYQAEFDQLTRRCATGRIEPSDRCTDCTPACTEDVSDSGPWALPDGQVQAFFSPADDAMAVLRGEVRAVRSDAPDPACDSPDADCICRPSGARYLCEYCGESGWGLVGQAEDRLLMSMYSSSDQCFALGVARAAQRGARVITIFDLVRAGSVYSNDDYLCEQGVPAYISQWGGGSPLVRNHNKSIVVDDVVFDGSMNLSASGADQNNENTLVLESPTLADAFDAYITSEAELLERMGVTACAPAGE